MRNIFHQSSMKLFIVLALILMFSPLNYAQQFNQEHLSVLSEKYAKASFPLLQELLSIPNDAFYPEEIEKNVEWCKNAFQARNFTTTRIETEGAPLLLAERKSSNAKKTVLIYLQIDGQPVDTTRWFQKNPYKPALKKTKFQWRLGRNTLEFN